MSITKKWQTLNFKVGKNIYIRAFQKPYHHPDPFMFWSTFMCYGPINRLFVPEIVLHICLLFLFYIVHQNFVIYSDISFKISENSDAMDFTIIKTCHLQQCKMKFETQNFWGEWHHSLAQPPSPLSHLVIFLPNPPPPWASDILFAWRLTYCPMRK